MATKLSDNQVHDLLVAAREALGNDDGLTVHGQTALKAARKALVLLQIGVVSAGEAIDLNSASPRSDQPPVAIAKRPGG